MNVPTVFISYSHDSEDHRQRVLGLAERLRDDGIVTSLDQYIDGSPTEGWPRWMLNQLDAADFVLVVCTETYYRRFRGHEVPGKGKGVDWEGALITNELYHARSKTVKFVPVFLSSPDENCIPEPLRGATYYALISETDYQSLYDFLLGQAGVEPRPVGRLKTKPRGKGRPLTFDPSLPQGSAGHEFPRIKFRPTRLCHTAARLVGRDDELHRLDAAWDDPNKNVVVVRAFGGMGKTSLVATWMAEMAGKGWRGAVRVFDWSFYSQGTSDQRMASADTFIASALRFFGDPDPTVGSAWDRGERLANLVCGVRSILVLDGLEPLLYPPGPMEGKLKDPGLDALLKGLVTRNAGLCVVTSREKLTDLQQHYGRAAEDVELLALSDLAGAALLHHHGANRAGVCEILPDDRELQNASREVHGHGLTLQLLGGYLRLAENGDIRRRDTVRLADADMEYQNDASRPYGHAFKAMEAYERCFEREGPRGLRQLAVLRLLGLFDRAAPKGCLAVLRKAPAIPGLTESLVDVSRREWALTTRRLQDSNLLKVQNDDSLDAHPLLREYFGHRLRADQPAAWRAGHRRLYEHLCESTKEGNKPTLDDLQPLYQAVAHGCKAGLQREARIQVYVNRIKQGPRAYSSHELGALGADLGAVACFFDVPWTHVSPMFEDSVQAWLFNEAAYRLQALGRLTEAIEPMRAAAFTTTRLGDWKNAARDMSNLSELELTMGCVAEALSRADEAVLNADRSGNAFERILTRTTHADVLHQAGCRGESRVRFSEAEEIQGNRQPRCPQLPSVMGARYCSLILAEAEREAGKPQWETERLDLLTVCRAVVDRVAKVHGRADESLLDTALRHLVTGRAALFAATISSRRSRADFEDLASSRGEGNCLDFAHAAMELAGAVQGFRRAGHQEDLPRSLLSRAWVRAITGPSTGPDSAQADLDEAWEISERGPMPLFLADIHLYRARLFFREACYPWQSPQHDLAEARRLIVKHGYLRRREELEDAEGAILGQSPSTS